METIGAFDAKTRLSELLDRAARGESFTITKHGQPVARLIPENGVDKEKTRAALERLKGLRGTIKGVSVQEMIDMVHEGHKW